MQRQTTEYRVSWHASGSRLRRREFRTKQSALDLVALLREGAKHGRNSVPVIEVSKVTRTFWKAVRCG